MCTIRVYLFEDMCSELLVTFVKDCYKILYIEGSLGYLIEILDSSQEGSFL